MTSVDRLRTAARDLREKATAATPGPWRVDGPFWAEPPGVSPDETSVQARPGVTGARRALVVEGTWDAKRLDADAPYIALVDPLFGLAVADLLERAAKNLEMHIPAWKAEILSSPDEQGETMLDDRIKQHSGFALAVADLILNQETLDGD